MANKIATKNIEGNVLVIDFTNGMRVSVDGSALSDEIKHAAMMHGLSQKLGDSYAGAKGDVDAAFAACKAQAELIEAGQWNGGRSSTGGIVAEALARVTGKTLGEVTAMLSGKDEEERKAIGKHPEVAQAVATIKAERAEARAKAATDTSDLMKLF